MARSKPNIILENIDEDFKAIQVCEADAIYAVCYQGRPIMVKRNQNIEIPNWQNWKYIKTAFPSPGHAFNLADKLNEQFNTDEFSVRLMLPGRTIKEATKDVT